MANYTGRFPNNRKEMIKTINSVGISKIRKYAEINHKKFDFDKALQVARYAALHGYEECRVFGISKQCAEQMMKSIYGFAMEISQS